MQQARVAELSDALVFFGATGDLAYKQIFPALQAMVRRGHLNVPIVGVARAGWNLDQLKARARDSLVHQGNFDADAFARLSELLRYVDGDYANPATFDGVREALAGAQRPLSYFAIPPSQFETVAGGQNHAFLKHGSTWTELVPPQGGDADAFAISNSGVTSGRVMWRNLNQPEARSTSAAS